MDGKYKSAQKIAVSGNFDEVVIDAYPFMLTGFERIIAQGNPVTIYIEGDGLAWRSKTQPSQNPTPDNPIALKLARHDNSANVIYLARPCQYTGRTDGQACDQSYWMGSRYAPEVLSAYNDALNQIRRKTGASGFHLVGFSGGATVAALLTGQRDDILTLRSVAGNLDHRAHSELHNVSYLNNSLNPPQYAEKLAGIPQVHFIGGHDKIVPKAIYDRYSAALPHQQCTRYHIVENAEHNKGWAEFWQVGQMIEPYCTRDQVLNQNGNGSVQP
ncbi:MAG: alpha/beta fold hydrolase [Alphaproteobacteria bacterium]